MAVLKTQKKLHETLPVGSRERAESKAHFEPRLTHGGKKSIGKRKTARPYFEKTPLHIVLSSERARGKWSLRHRRNHARVMAQIYRYAHRFQIHIYRASNEGHSLHLFLKGHERKQLADFLRVLAGRVAVTTTGAKKGVKRIGKFWSSLCWSRLVNFGAEFYRVRAFFIELEKGMGTVVAETFELIDKDYYASPPR